ncbi:tripartite motif-containing protein 56 [Elysia marginata]|uniref:Tripartite motif-containing protein 56 n=1 Tax=Elysia marginata TaxID=1093978 RepID=A0AAV4FWF7_9GAST|nr:tripartite motif-containing protein 56 [Elysia marginata]
MDSDKIERLRERLLHCAVCMDEYRDPRILPCHHTLCYECIENVVQSSSTTGRFFRCPQCRSEVCVPRGGIKDLPINFYIISLQDELGSTGYSGTCDVCNKDWLLSQFRCIDCDLDICRFCIHAHRLETHVDPPRILRVESTASPNQLSSFQTCMEHPDQTLQLFCCTCNQAICISCSCSDHRRHKVIPVSIKLQESQAYLQEELDKLTSEKRMVAKAGKELERTRASVVESCNRAMLNIDAQAHTACEVIMNKKLNIVKQILLSEKNQIEGIDNALKDFKSYVQRLERGLAFLLDLQDSDICLEVVDTYKDFSQKLKAARQGFVSNHIKIHQHQFSPSGWNRMLDWNFGFTRNFYHFGNLGALSTKRLCLSIDSKNMDLVLKPKVVVRLLESSAFKRFLQVLAAFLFCQLILHVLDSTGLLGSITKMFSCAFNQVMAFWLILSNVFKEDSET